MEIPQSFARKCPSSWTTSSSNTSPVTSLSRMSTRSRLSPTSPWSRRSLTRSVIKWLIKFTRTWNIVFLTQSLILLYFPGGSHHWRVSQPWEPGSEPHSQSLLLAPAPGKRRQWSGIVCIYSEASILLKRRVDTIIILYLCRRDEWIGNNKNPTSIV